MELKINFIHSHPLSVLIIHPLSRIMQPEHPEIKNCLTLFQDTDCLTRQDTDSFISLVFFFKLYFLTVLEKNYKKKFYCVKNSPVHRHMKFI